MQFITSMADSKCILSEQFFGKTTDGQEAVLICLQDSMGNVAKLSSYAAALQSLSIRDRNGTPLDVCLGYDRVSDYEKYASCFGSTMGRCTGRINGASVTLSGKTYNLSENRPGYHMHGGFCGFHKRHWDYELLQDGVCFMLQSPDGDEGYPGNLTAKVSYRWIEPGVLLLSYDCVSDKETIINLTNHSYFNLSGHNSGSAASLAQYLSICADHVALLDENNMINGTFLPVEGTPLDFRAARTIGEQIDHNDPLLRCVGGYDHSYPVCGNGLRPAAFLYAADTGIGMSVETDLPVLGLYSANFLAEHMGKNNSHYGKNSGICLETQFLPNAVNLPSYQPQPVFAAGVHYTYHTLFRFHTS